MVLARARAGPRDVRRGGSALSERAGGLWVAGWRERVTLPGWGVARVRAKLDTGARTSAIHVAHMDRLANGRVRFEVVFRERPERRTAWVESEVVRESVVKPSSGVRQVRPVCRVLMRLGPVEREIELGLVAREGMLCRMLVGRSALAGVCVDPSRKYVLTPAWVQGGGEGGGGSGGGVDGEGVS